MGTGPLKVPTAHNVGVRVGKRLRASLVSQFVLVNVAACSADPDAARDDRDHIDGDFLRRYRRHAPRPAHACLPQNPGRLAAGPIAAALTASSFADFQDGRLTSRHAARQDHP